MRCLRSLSPPANKSVSYKPAREGVASGEGTLSDWAVVWVVHVIEVQLSVCCVLSVSVRRSWISTHWIFFSVLFFSSCAKVEFNRSGGKKSSNEKGGMRWLIGIFWDNWKGKREKILK